MKNILLSGKNVCKSFFRDGVETRILNSVNADIYEGDFTVIMGASGAGKSTLLYALSGMDDITDGEIFFRGQKLSGLSENKMSSCRAGEFGFVFQQTHLVSNLTLFENVAVAGYVGGLKDVRTVRERAEKLLEKMHAEKAKDRLPSQVSGGEAQRAAIARAMINDPAIIFADEPTGALNRANSEEVLELLTELNGGGQSILMVTHDVRAAIHGSRILYLEDGKILDELNLPAYKKSDSRAREDQVSRWLSELCW